MHGVLQNRGTNLNVPFFAGLHLASGVFAMGSMHYQHPRMLIFQALSWASGYGDAAHA